jgi:hypothetical protein
MLRSLSLVGLAACAHALPECTREDREAAMRLDSTYAWTLGVDLPIKKSRPAVAPDCWSAAFETIRQLPHKISPGTCVY